MTAVQHGGGLDRAIAEFGGEKADWLDLSTGINPNPYPIPAVPNDVWHRLPDESLMDACLHAARIYYDVPDDAAIVAAPGTQALIQLLPRLWPAERFGIVSPTYNEYARNYQRAGSQIVPLPSLGDTPVDVKTVVVGNPNNPDGRSDILGEFEALKMRGCQIIVDEAFGDVAPEKSLIGEADRPDVLILKSFGKFFGLAGLRLGFAVGAPNLIQSLSHMIGPWAVPGPALYIGAKALCDDLWIGETRTALTAMRGRVEALLQSVGFELIGSTDLFVTASHIDSSAVAKSLAQNHILVRSFDYAPTWIRFGLPASDLQFNRLEDALKNALAQNAKLSKKLL